MLNHPTHERLIAFGLHGMAKAFEEQRRQPDIAALGFEERLGLMIDREATGFHARVVQHECDHLIGKLYPMRVRDFNRFGFTEVLFPEISAAEDD